MTGLLLGHCRNCDAPVSHFARVCPACGAANLPNPFAIAAAVAGVLLVGGAIGLGAWLLRGKPPPAASQAERTPAESGVAGDNYDWLVQAMADCEAEAKLKLDTLHFLIVPLTTTGVTLPGWTPVPISNIADIGALLGATDALIGLRNRVFVLYRKPVTFEVSDPASKTVYKWKPAVGVTSLKTSENGLTNLMLGFEIPDVRQAVAWGPTISLSKGTCYWINAVIRRDAGAK
jgi:hypothetical protein